MPPDQFWQQTPRLFVAVSQARSGALDRAQRMTAWQAWTTAALGRIEKFPKLDAILPKQRRTRRQTVAEMTAIARQWTAAVQGKRR